MKVLPGKKEILIYLFFSVILATGCNRVTIEDGIMDEGQECFRISTPSATYFYQKEAGGFSSILDKDGNDWISFKQDTTEDYPASAATSFRGLPNLVFQSDDGGAGHPGFKKCNSEKISENKIRTVSKSGKWEWIWSFYNDYAELEILKTDPENPYWFLYEGTINGEYHPQTQYWGTDKEGPNRSLPDYYFGNQVYDTWKWAYFGEEFTPRIFFVLHVNPDDLTDTFSYLGNTSEGIIAPDGMVVFGFGRQKDAQPLMKRTGNRFIIGFVEREISDDAHHQLISDKLEKRFED